MFLFYFSMGLTILSNVLYHFAQKLTPSAANPVLSLAITYAAAAVVCLALLPLFPVQSGFVAALRQINWKNAKERMSQIPAVTYP